MEMEWVVWSQAMIVDCFTHCGGVPVYPTGQVKYNGIVNHPQDYLSNRFPYQMETMVVDIHLFVLVLEWEIGDGDGDGDGRWRWRWRVVRS